MNEEEFTNLNCEIAAAFLENHGIPISMPWHGDMSDLERERFDGLLAAVKRVQKETNARCVRKLKDAYVAGKYTPLSELIAAISEG